MITKKELAEYAQLRGLKNLGHAEKDYLQNILLFIIYHRFGREIVFKGGTALYKCFGLNRFSEDLDFNAQQDVDSTFIGEGLKRFKIEYEKKESSFKRSKSIALRIKGPLYNGERNSFCKVVLEFSLREEAQETPIIKTIGRFMEEIPSFDVFVMAEKEILSEKVRAIMTRNKARDVYDLWFLLKQNVEFDEKMINQKMKYYKKEFDGAEFLGAIMEKESIWHSELSGFIQNIPEFKKVISEIKASL